MTVEKPKPKQLLRPIITGADSAMNQSQFLAITCNSLEVQEKSHVHGAVGFGFGFASHWLKNWRESFEPIITFDSHLKTALLESMTKSYLVEFKCVARATFDRNWNLIHSADACFFSYGVCR